MATKARGAGPQATTRTRSWWGWGWEEDALPAAEQEALATYVAAQQGLDSLTVHNVPDLDTIDMREPRVQPPAALAAICSTDKRERAAHTHGKAFRDIVRNLMGRLDNPPDVVARPTDEAELVAVLEWCSEAGLAAIPFGGGSSVVGGVEARVGDDYAGAVSIDLTALDRVLEIDRQSRAARIQGGALGPVLEDQLRPEGLTLRHFPQSFEFSTLGGWLATRSGGHFATLYTHIDDLTESMRVVTPSGVVESRRLPGSGAGPSPDRMFLGSEGTLGIITEAWMRLQERPRWRGSASLHFDSYEAGVTATRAIAQAGLYPTNCRLLDGGEAALSAGTSNVGALLVLGFESADHPVQPWLERAVELGRENGAQVPEGPRYSDEAEKQGADTASRQGAAGAWRGTFVRAPYLRDALIRVGMVVDTFETSITWDRFGEFHEVVSQAARSVVDRVCGGGIITCRFTHVYPDGPAPYYSVIAPGRWGDQVAQWDEIKAAVSEVVAGAGGTITHHHAVGRDHRPWYDRQRPEPFAAALRAAKSSLDPSGVLNPGVLIDPA
ncbi:MAG: FAD-binding oxidoreductase [Candidatus Dormiibacterota bacterium]